MIPACRNRFLRLSYFVCGLVSSSAIAFGQERPAAPDAAVQTIEVGKFPTEVLHVYDTASGLPDNDALAILLTKDRKVYAGTTKGLARFNGEKWQPVGQSTEPVRALAQQGNQLLAVTGRELIVIDLAGNGTPTLIPLPEAAQDPKTQVSLAANDQTALLGCEAGLFVRKGDASSFAEDLDYRQWAGEGRPVRQIAAGPRGEWAVAAAGGLYFKPGEGNWRILSPADGKRSWSPRDVRATVFDRDGRLWFASPQGVGKLEGETWKLFTGDDGLPYDDFTTMAAGEPGVVWFGTSVGAIRFDGTNWNYRRSRRWLPSDAVRSIAVRENGDAWFATSGGVGQLVRRMITLAEKATFYELEIDKYHRRTPYGYVHPVGVGKPGEKSDIRQTDSDNDGLWTAMYGAGECFAYAARKDPQSKARAKAAFDAVRFLSQVTQGGAHPAPKGFPARSILPVSGRNPNDHDSPANDRRRQQQDPNWKVIEPRWPTSADGQWYWKSDTSSDELDGHYFLYACYYDFAADTEEEKARVRQVVKDITDHLLEHDYYLVDHDGKPTRWGIYNPKALASPYMASGRGLNSLSILSYLRVAYHMTGDEKYMEHYRKLINEQGYAANVLFPKTATGPGTGNQSDDEMAFMCYYDLLRYETDPDLLRMYRQSLGWYWSLEQPERNPLFNFIYASVSRSGGGGGARRRGGVPQAAMEDAVDTLKRFPLDRFNWDTKNSHRIDIIPMGGGGGGGGMVERNSGHLRNGKALPVDERFFEFWNHNPFRLDTGGNGGSLADGAVFLLPYYFGLYYGFIKEVS